MSKCLNCKKYEDCKTGSGLTWPCGAYVPKVITNADHIRSMSDEELAGIINRVEEPCSCCELTETDGACTETLCDNAMLRWLKQPYKEEV